MATRTVNYSAGESLNQPVPLALITVSHNPRRPLRKLQDLGFDPMAFCHEFGLSADEEKRLHFVTTIRENHPEIECMWQSINTYSQIQSVILRDFRVQVGAEYETRYGIACGERRFIACVFGQALTGKPCPVMARIKKMTVKQAYWMGVQENIQREPMTEVEKGQIFAKYAEEHTLVEEEVTEDVEGEVTTRTVQKIVERTDTATQEALPMTEVARHFEVPYHEARGRAALATKLAPERLALYESGKLNLTDAIREALGEPSHKSKPAREGRRTPLTMKQMEALFDETPRTDDYKLRLETLCEVMKLDMATALAESDARSQLREEQEARQVEKSLRKKAAAPTDAA
jgi:ParB/RepB/Spo0J family partition protein